MRRKPSANHRHEGDPRHHLGTARGHRLRIALSATQLNATTTVAGTFVYTPAASTVSRWGRSDPMATFTPTDAANFTTATKSVAINVLKATPVVTWANRPTSYTAQPLGRGAPVERDASVPGTFVYALRRRRPERGCGAETVGDLHPDRWRELHGEQIGRDQCVKATPV